MYLITGPAKPDFVTGEHACLPSRGGDHRAEPKAGPGDAAQAPDYQYGPGEPVLCYKRLRL